MKLGRVLLFSSLKVRVLIGLGLLSYSPCLFGFEHLGKKLPEELVMAVLMHLDQRNLEKLSRVSRDFKRLANDRRLMQKYDDAVKLSDGCWLRWSSALKRHKTAQIIFFNNLAYVSTRWPPWQAEVKAAARDDREPCYLKVISDLTRAKISFFVQAKAATGRGLAKVQRKRLVICLFLAMRNYFCSASATAKEVSLGEADFLCPSIKTALNRVSALVWDAFHGAGLSSELEPAGASTMTLAWNEASNALGAYDEPMDLTASPALAYRLAEKAVLLSFWQTLEAALERAWTAASEQMLPQEESVDSIFCSAEGWQTFKLAYFSSLLAADDTGHFLQAWLEQIELLHGSFGDEDSA